MPSVIYLPVCVPTGLIISSALVIWKSLMLVTRSESPVGAEDWQIGGRLGHVSLNHAGEN